MCASRRAAAGLLKDEMATPTDAYDQPLTTSSATALERYVEGVACILTMNSGAEQALRAAIAADEGFALPHAALALIQQQAGKPQEAKSEAERAKALLPSTTEREQRHVQAVAAGVEGKPAEALQLIEEHLRSCPRDALLLRQTRMLLNASGRADRKQRALAICKEVAPAYSEDAWFLGNASFAYNELFHFETARRLAERSFELDERNCDCAHSIAQRERSGHLKWHRALFELEQGHWDEVTRIYEHLLRPRKHPGGVQIALADSASLVWRYRLHGRELPGEWPDEVRDLGITGFPRAGQAFPDVHKAMAMALAGDLNGVEALANDCRDLLAAGRLPAGPVVPAIIEAVGAFAEGDYDRAVALLEPVQEEIPRVGGSHAQFDVFNDTLMAAYVRSGRSEKAAPMLRERLEHRPSLRGEAWLQSLELLQAPTVPEAGR
jgi:tetratricopeptide (TPR) repeat protein